MTVRVIYSDLDGTMVGPGGSFWHAEDRTLSLEPARALLELHQAGVALVLVSGRTRAQLVEASAIFGADGFVAELGALLAWDRGQTVQTLPSAAPPPLTRVPDEVLAAVLDRFDLVLYAPWHEGHEVDVLLRGEVDVTVVEAFLAEQGCDWLRLRDNGRLPDRAGGGHVYHLLPDGISKGHAVAADLARRGLTAAEAMAIGDSLSDLAMAEHVGRVWVTANGARLPAVAAAAAALPQATVTAEAVGLGWVEAVRAALAR